jgi:hypothetical protein
MSGKDYVGKIKNSGAQTVKAPVKPDGKRGKASVKTGTDLRTGK